MIFDPATTQGASALSRLRRETLGWLTTAFPDGRMASSLVWFLWKNDELIVYSRDNAKVRNITGNPNVAFNLNSDEYGGSVLTLRAMASIDRDYPASNNVPEYADKYRSLIAGIGMTPDRFAADYSVPIRLVPTSYRSS